MQTTCRANGVSTNNLNRNYLNLCPSWEHSVDCLSGSFCADTMPIDKLYYNFDIDQVAAMTDRDVEEILSRASTDQTEGVVQHSGKDQPRQNYSRSESKRHHHIIIEQVFMVRPILNQLQTKSNMPSKTARHRT